MNKRDARQLFAGLRGAFAPLYPRVPAPRLVISDRRYTDPRHRAKRDLAYADCGGTRPRVTLLARALRLPYENVVGLMLHELGHIYDDRVSEPGAERRADRIAKRATGFVIRYDKDFIQTIGRGKSPRPPHLHR